MVCEKCGSVMDDDSNVCAKCGWQLSNEKLDGELSTDSDKVVHKKKKQGLIIALVIIIVLSVVAGIATPIILLSGKSHDEKTNKQNNYFNDDNLYGDREAQANTQLNVQANADKNYTYISENDFYPYVLGVAFTDTDNGLIKWSNDNGLQYSFDQNQKILRCFGQDPLNQVLDNVLDAAGEELLKEHEFGVGDIENIYDGMTDESNEGVVDSILGGVWGYLEGVIEEKVDNAIEGGVKEGLNTAASDNNIYYTFAFDDNNQVKEYLITKLVKNRENLDEAFIEKYGTPTVENNVYIWNGQVSGTPAVFYMWIEVNKYNDYVWQLYVKKITQ